VFHLLPAHERAVVYTLGRTSGVKGPGLVVLIPFLQTMRRVDVRGGVVQLKNVSVAYRVVDPVRALEQVADYHQAMEKLAETAFARAIEGRDSDALVF
jgi:regulator of protease activity HflC (stomatin/prohibitin superfamily)